MRPCSTLLAAASTAAVLALSGCAGGATASTTPGAGGPAVTEQQLPAPSLAVGVDEGAVVGFAAPFTVTAADGRLGHVSLTTADGQVVGVEPTSGTSWTSPAVLDPGTGYVLKAHAVGPDGQETHVVRTFRTTTPQRVLTTDVTPWGDQTVGIGHPITVRLSEDVEGQVERAAVERALVVTASNPVGEASWSWIDDDLLQYRPKEFWPPSTRVVVDVDLAGVRAGEGLWGTTSRQVTFNVGRSLVVSIDDATHTATVHRDGQVVRTMGVSMGKDGPSTVTRSGVKVVMDRHTQYRMQSSTLGSGYTEDAYDVTVPYAMRLTWSGEFLHGAPWNANIGSRNTSHGCVNLEVDDARWLYENVLVGDPVVTAGTSRQMEEGNGLGGAWNVSWPEWTARSALG